MGVINMFAKTGYGKKLFEDQLPSLIKAVQKIAQLLELHAKRELAEREYVWTSNTPIGIPEGSGWRVIHVDPGERGAHILWERIKQ